MGWMDLFTTDQGQNALSLGGSVVTGGLDWINQLMANAKTEQQQAGMEEIDWGMIDSALPESHRLSGQFMTGSQGNIDWARGFRGDLSQQIRGETGQWEQDLGEWYNQGFQDVRGWYGDRTENVMGRFSGMMDQERADIAQAYGNLQTQQAQQLTETGLGSSSVMGAMKQGVARERTDALGRLEGRGRQQEIGALMALTGQDLAAGERWKGQQLAARERGRGRNIAAHERLGMWDYTEGYREKEQFIGDQYNMGTAPLNLGIDLFRGLQSTKGGIQHQYNPTPLGFHDRLGSGAAAAVQAPDTNSWMGPAMMGGGTAAGIGLASLLAPATGGASYVGLGMGFPSDRALKEDIRDLDGNEVLDGFKKLPVSRWKYKKQQVPGAPDPLVDHVGPMAQDFQATFGLGDGKTIDMIDANGVTMAALSQLAKENEQLKQRLERLEARQ